MNTTSTIKQDVMRRVYFIFAVKKLGRVFAVRLGLLSVLIAATSFWVSVPHVLNNMPSFFQVSKFFSFVMSAFLNTNFTIQLFSVGSVLVMFYLVRDIVSVIKSSGGNKALA